MDESSCVQIEDSRDESVFVGISFSGFKKVDVKRECVQCMLACKVEAACYWSAELVCAGHYADWWEMCMCMYAKHIHVGNPKLACYLAMRLSQFRACIREHPPLSLRNHTSMRVLFAEVIAVLCHAKRQHPMETIKLRPTDFVMDELSERLEATEQEYGVWGGFSTDEANRDPPSLGLPFNEYCYHLSVRGGNNAIKALYWVEWIMRFDQICKRGKQPLQCARRAHLTMVPMEHQRDTVFLLWDACLNMASSSSPMCRKVVEALLQLYVCRYSRSVFSKRRYLLYMAVTLVLEPQVAWSSEVVPAATKAFLDKVRANIHLLYGELKQHEQVGSTRHVFQDWMNLPLTYLQDSMDRMDQLFGTHQPTNP